MTVHAAPRVADGGLLLADISGYTGFLRDVATAHEHDAFANGAIPQAYAVMSTLLQAIIEQVVPPFTLSKIEGDAVFAYSPDLTALPRGAALQAFVQDCYDEFRRLVDTAHETWTCTCDACLRIDALDLKFVLHAGPFVIQQIAGSTELVGPHVVMAHRLLKNDAAERLGHHGYALLTAEAASRLEVPTDGAVPLVATYEHYAPIATFLFPFQPRERVAGHAATT